ncbi:MAG: hypothetical protein AAB551_00460 [Patescibacteria group bacterium]
MKLLTLPEFSRKPSLLFRFRQILRKPMLQRRREKHRARFTLQVPVSISIFGGLAR